jgi:hypothetical protein
MSNVIAFLESMGRDPALVAGGEEFTKAVDSLGMDDQARAALLAGDVGSLSELLGGRTRMLCALLPADDDQKDDEGEGDGEDDGEQPPASPSIGLH